MKLPGRVTYTIDKRGKIRSVFSSLTDPEKHAEEAMSALRKLNLSGDRKS